MLDLQRPAKNDAYNHKFFQKFSQQRDMETRFSTLRSHSRKPKVPLHL
jgi:hypothetical protein